MKKIVLFLTALFLFFQCTNNKPLPNTYELLDREGKSGLRPPLVLRPVRVAEYRKTPRAGTRGTLLLGKVDSLSSRIALDCRNFNKSKFDTTAEILGAELKLYSDAASDSNLTIPVSVLPIRRNWEESTVTLDTLKGAFDAPLFQATLQVKKNSWSTLTFSDLSFLRAWIRDNYRTTPTFFGIAVQANGEGMAQFVSSDASLLTPNFRIVFRKTDGQVDTAVVALSKDASLLRFADPIAEGTPDFAPSLLRVGAGSGRRFLLRFDLSSLPKSATIHQALLSFKVDRDHSNTTVEGQMAVSIIAVKNDSTWEKPNELEVIGTSAVPYDMAVGSAELFSFDDSSSNLNSPVLYVSRTVQRWLTGVYANCGFLIYATNEGGNWQQTAFYSGLSDSLQAPTLTITYSLPAEPRFGGSR
ncbi:MAG: DNRLRE domain-containing protein [candidate division KSB1 bacterium]|nr:DNRLRE domain-containing protein [candidate division KSB1 bacterium]